MQTDKNEIIAQIRELLNLDIYPDIMITKTFNDNIYLIFTKYGGRILRERIIELSELTEEVREKILPLIEEYNRSS